MTCKNLMYISAAIFFLAATICISVFTYYHTKKAKATGSIEGIVSVTYYIDKDDKEAMANAASNAYWAVNNIDY